MTRRSLVFVCTSLLVGPGGACTTRSVAIGVESDTDGTDETAGTDSVSETSGGSAAEDGSTSGDPTDDSGGVPVPSCGAGYTAVEEILVTHCGSCHNPSFGGNNGELEDVSDLNQLVGDGWLLAGNAEDSPIYERVALDEMPPPGFEPRPDSADLALIVDVVDNCYVQTCEPPAETIEGTAVLDSILFDLNSASSDDQPFYRYFTLAHLYNAGYCADQLESYRQGVSKLINALSSEAQIEPVTAVDPSETILRIDLRDYGWDEPLGVFADRWEALVANSPYAVEYVEDQAVPIKQLTQTSVPTLLGDAFIDFAAQPGAGAEVTIGNGTNVGYHEFANAPGNVVDLQSQLSIDIPSNIATEEVARAGFLESGPSGQLRLVERHEALLSAVWLTYNSSDEQSIFADPLEFDGQGAQIIYPLANGLHGYLLIAQTGERVDEDPDDTVIDPNQADGNVLNGISCFGCHGALLATRPDEIRDYVLASTEFDAAAKSFVENVYPPAAEFNALLANDTASFHSALEQAGVDPTSPIEPVTFAFHTFAKNVTLTLAAAELGIAESDLVTQIGALDTALSPLLQGSVSRDVWTSLYADTVCKLQLGLANDDDCP